MPCTITDTPVSHTSLYDYLDAADIEDFIAQIVTAVEQDDAQWFAQHSFYPSAGYNPQGEPIFIPDQRTFIEYYDQILIKEEKDCLAKQVYAPSSSWKGFLIADGRLWFSPFCHEDLTNCKLLIISIGRVGWCYRNPVCPDEYDIFAPPSTK